MGGFARTEEIHRMANPDRGNGLTGKVGPFFIPALLTGKLAFPELDVRLGYDS